MKFAVAGLCLMGVIAACCAALLVNALRASASVDKGGPTTAESADVQVLMATRSVPAMTVIDGSVVSLKMMPKSQAPHQYLSNPVDVVGRVLAVAVSEGQAYTPNCFADEAGSRQLASVIPPGKRAVGISVADYSALDNLVFPGSIVDVIVSFKQQDGDGRGAMTKTLLENVHVLAIEEQTVVSPGKTVSQALDNNGRNGSRKVTLLVDTKQAKALELGMQQGTLSLALRNPMDASDADKGSVSVKSLLGEEFVPPPVVVAAPATEPVAVKPAPAPSWDMTVIRGGAMDSVSVPLRKRAK